MALPAINLVNINLSRIYERASDQLEADWAPTLEEGLRPSQAPDDAVWLDDEDRAAALEPIIQRNLYPDGDSNGAEVNLARYMAAQAAELDGLDAKAITHKAQIFQGDLLMEMADDA